ncbi:nucleotidyltransferase family protein (plasmid) [Agrobacterium tumefaciens]|nr:nucleotidyltransferase family protein [Agrobacterium tumefaciens]
MKIAIAVLAAGSSSRMRGVSKLLKSVDGEPLVRRSARQALSSGCDDVTVVVVTGHRCEAVSEALEGLPVRIVENPHYTTGIASSIRAAVASLEPDVDGLMIHLADMPGVTGHNLAELIKTFVGGRGDCIVQATHGGQAGNPAVLPKSMFEALKELEGDTGARRLFRDWQVLTVEIGPGALLDLDTPEAFESYFAETR